MDFRAVADMLLSVIVRDLRFVWRLNECNFSLVSVSPPALFGWPMLTQDISNASNSGRRNIGHATVALQYLTLAVAVQCKVTRNSFN